ncbi:MAG: hypothetical protein R6V60_01055 [Desulfobacterales bacterium]
MFEKEGDNEITIASFHKDPQTQSGQKSMAQRRAEEYCEFLNHRNLADEDSLTFD